MSVRFGTCSWFALVLIFGVRAPDAWILRPVVGTRVAVAAAARVAAGAIAVASTFALPAAASATASAPAIPTTDPAAAAAGKDAQSFESLVRAAVPMSDLGTLLAPFAGKCDAEARELDRLRCLTTRSYLRRVIPQRSFWAVADDPQVIGVSEFDASIKGYHLSVAGCLSCARPVTVGRTKERRMITLKAPDREAESLRAAVELSRSAVGFDSLAEAKTWLEQTRPELRTQFVFQPADAEWSFGPSRGYAMKLLGMRVFNRCTGEVLVSRPPSTGIADMPGIDDGCKVREPDDDPSQRADSAEGLPPELSKDVISKAMGTLRAQVFACYEKYRVPGRAQLDYVIAGNGTVRSVRLEGAFLGTPTGTCVLEAAQNARFQSFAGERQQFSYPFFLRD